MANSGGHLGAEVHGGVDVLDVVGVLQGVDEPEDLARTVDVDLDLGAGDELDLGGVVVHPRLRQSGTHSDDVTRFGVDLEGLAHVLNLLGAGVQDGHEDGVLVNAVGLGDLDDACG